MAQQQLYDNSWQKVPCHIAKGWNASGGYIGIGVGTLAHRKAWEDVHGTIPKGMCVLHKCDNRKCDEVKHLFLGTRADNNRDRDAKGRQVCVKRILSDDDVRLMRKMRAEGYMCIELAEIFGIRATTVSGICRKTNPQRAGVL